MNDFELFAVSERHQANLHIRQFLKEKHVQFITTKNLIPQWISDERIMVIVKKLAQKQKKLKPKNEGHNEAETEDRNMSLQPLKAPFRVKLGDCVAVHRSILLGAKSVESSSNANENTLSGNAKVGLDIEFEDEDIVVVNKPVGMVVHPSSNGFRQSNDTLVHGLLHRYGREGLSRGEPNEVDPSLPGIRPGIVHRIDRDTSGLLVIAKNDRAHAALKEQFAKHTDIERSYLTVVYNHVKFERGTVDVPIARHPSIPNKRITHHTSSAVVPSPAGDGVVAMETIKVHTQNRKSAKDAITHYEVLERYTLRGAGNSNSNGFSHIKCKLETGRTHQIRVHMASIGRPLLGDELYGTKNSPAWFEKIVSEHAKANNDGQNNAAEDVDGVDVKPNAKKTGKKGKKGKKRPSGKDRNGGQLLHAASLSFMHPTKGERMEFNVDPPAHFAAVLKHLRSKTTYTEHDSDGEDSYII